MFWGREVRAGFSQGAGGVQSRGCSTGVTQRLHTASVQHFSLASLQLMNVTGGEAGGKWSRNARLPSQISSASVQTGSHRVTAAAPVGAEDKRGLARVGTGEGHVSALKLCPHALPCAEESISSHICD